MSSLLWLIATIVNIAMLFKLLNIDDEIKELISSIIKLKDKGLIVLKIMLSVIPVLNVIVCVFLCIVWLVRNAGEIGDIDLGGDDED